MEKLKEKDTIKQAIAFVLYAHCTMRVTLEIFAAILRFTSKLKSTDNSHRVLNQRLCLAYT